MVDDAMATMHRERTRREGQQRLMGWSEEAFQAPIRDQLLGWRERFVSRDPSAWKIALNDIFRVLLNVLPGGKGTAIGKWEDFVSDLAAVLSLPARDDDALTRLQRLLGSDAPRPALRKILKAVESSARDGDVDGSEMASARGRAVIDRQVWHALAHIDLARFRRDRDAIFLTSDKSGDRELPVMSSYLRTVSDHLIRGVDETLFYERWHSDRGLEEEQIYGVRTLIEQAVEYSIQNAKSPADSSRIKWHENALLERLTSLTSMSVVDPVAASESVAMWLQELSSGQAYMVRTRLVNIIDSSWCQTLDDFAMRTTNLDRESDGRPKEFRNRAALQLPALLLNARDDCALSVVSTIERLRSDKRTAEPLMRDAPSQVATILDVGLRTATL